MELVATVNVSKDKLSAFFVLPGLSIKKSAKEKTVKQFCSMHNIRFCKLS